MNLDVLHRLIDRYEEKIDKIYNTENYELFKWQAAKTWQTEWNKPEDAFPSFADRFTAARKDFDVFIDGKIMPGLSSVEGLGDKACEQVEEAASKGRFSSLDNFRDRTKVSKTSIDKLVELGILTDLPQSDQLTLDFFLGRDPS